MRIRFFILGLLLLGTIAAGEAPPQPALTLADAFQAAVHRSETLSEQDLQIVAARERETEARGAMLPNLSAAASYLVQDEPPEPESRQLSPRQQPSVKLTLAQPLFRGLRDLSALSQRRHLTEAEEHTKAQALDQLYNDIAQSYFTVLGLEQDLKNLTSQITQYKERIGELKQRTRTGESNTTDALVAEADEVGIETQQIQAQGQLRVARETFAFLTGLDRGTPLREDKAAVPERAPLDGYLTKIDQRPDLLAAKARLAASEEGVDTARGEHLPSADLTGNYYLRRPDGLMHDVRWDIQAVLTVPIFSGGISESHVRQAVTEKQTADLEVTRVRRQAEEDIRSLYETLGADLEQLNGLKRNVALGSRNYQLLRKDYERGLARNIDVLQALTVYQETQRALDRALYTSRIDSVRLQTAAGQRPGAKEGT